MKGFPKYINSRQDIEHLKGSHPVELKDYLQSLVDTKDEWLVVGPLTAGDSGVTDATHKVVENVDQQTGEVKERWQFELREDPNGPIFRFGFASVDEVRDIIAEL